MAISRGVLFFLLALCSGYFAVSRAQDDDRCERGWEYDDGSCYLRVNKRKSWNKAQSDCEAKNASLVTVNNMNEQKFLDRLLGDKGSWCGLNKLNEMNQFTWISGEQSDFTYWAYKEPKMSQKKLCVHISEAAKHKWHMAKCAEKHRYICEKAAAPENPCASIPCKNGGTCSQDGQGYRCECTDKYTGPQCETEIVLDPCASGPCQNGGKCYKLSQEEYFCLCPSEFKGNNCEQVSCAGSPCKNGGSCVESGDRAFCQCPSEFSGNLCQGKKPEITKDPIDSIRLTGDDVTFCCEAEGDPAPKYEWFMNDISLKKEGSRLRLERLSMDNAGRFKCQATNEYGVVFSSEAELKMVDSAGSDDTCNPTPSSNIETLPPGCTEDSTGSNSVNVGTCSHETCVKRGQGDSEDCGGQGGKRQCCSPSSMVDSSVTCIGGVKFNVQKVSSCACADCAVPNTVVRGRAVDPDGNPLKAGEITVEGDPKTYRTDLGGYFKIPVNSGTKRLILTITDKLVGKLQETTKGFELHEGQVSFYTIVLQKKPPPIKFPANQEKKISLDGSGGKPSFVDLDIPANAFIGADGKIYDGEITANIGMVDPRSQADLAAAPGDFSAIDENGEEVVLRTEGILRPAFTDNSGNKLSLGKNITVRLDADQLDIPDGVTVFQWYLNKQTGRWVKFGVLRTEEGGSLSKRQSPRKFFVGDITPNVPYDNINWDSVEVASYVRVRAPPGTVVTRIGLSSNGQSYTSYRQETVPASGTLCILSYRRRPAILQAELNGAPLIPQQPIGFPPVVNPQIINGSSAGSAVKIQSFQFDSFKATDAGPIYLKGESGRCRQYGSNDLAFEFQQANAGEAFHWESPRNQDPSSDAFWNARITDICFVKAVVSGSRPDSVIYVKSTGKASGQPTVDYGYTAEKSALVGNQGVVCLEYRCNEGPSATYQTHLQILTLTGSCTIQPPRGTLGAQDRCDVTPDADSNQEQNFCVPRDLQGGDVGLYMGDSGVARNRCLTGNNQYNGGRPTTTADNPTVRLSCS